MSFGFNPSDYLGLLDDSHDEYRREPLSIRRAVVCCIFANHLPDYIFAAYGVSDSAKLHGATSINDYRCYLATAEPALAVIRDLCDYAKHGATLARKSVTVAKTEQAKTWEMDAVAFMIGIPSHHPAEKLVVTHKDGSEGWME